MVGKRAERVSIWPGHQPLDLVHAAGLLPPRFLHQLVLRRQTLAPQIVPSLSVGLFDIVLVGQAPGVLAETHALLIGGSDGRSQVGTKDSPTPFQRCQLIDGPDRGPDVVRNLQAAGMLSVP